MGISKRDIELIELLNKDDRNSLEKDICENGHRFRYGKYYFCPICGGRLKKESRIGMSEISETEIKAMTKEQNYMRGYKDGKSDVLDKIRTEIEKVVWEDVIVSLDGTDEVRIPCLDPDDVFEIIDKYKTESEE